ncbi:MAG: sigma-70 family RNA polymerase sigma factor [Clostridia bacterium]|nr:sigma-70 family RNA polymerase sigma factor [Clostridia bacterium]MBQ8340208.1 sigma-70 family RNA polymerase sigma factor [Clostridia bacterium]
MEGNTRQARHYALLRAAQSADAEEAAAATERLLLENMGLVRTAALRFRERGVEYEDLVQIGTVGMLRAIRTFDLARGTAFSTFAVPLIVGEIRRSLRDDGLLHVSRTYKQLAAELSGARQRIQMEEGREPSICELAALCHVSQEEAAMALSAVSPVASLSERVFEDDSGELGDRITDDESEHEPAILTDRLALREAIGKMPAMWRRILLLRYYRCRTQQETADLLGLSQVKVSREEKKILSFLRGEMIVS